MRSANSAYLLFSLWSILAFGLAGCAAQKYEAFFPLEIWDQAWCHAGAEGGKDGPCIDLVEDVEVSTGFRQLQVYAEQSVAADQLAPIQFERSCIHAVDVGQSTELVQAAARNVGHPIMTELFCQCQDAGCIELHFRPLQLNGLFIGSPPHWLRLDSGANTGREEGEGGVWHIALLSSSASVAYVYAVLGEVRTEPSRIVCAINQWTRAPEDYGQSVEACLRLSQTRPCDLECLEYLFGPEGVR